MLCHMTHSCVRYDSDSCETDDSFVCESLDVMSHDSFMS